MDQELNFIQSPWISFLGLFFIITIRYLGFAGAFYWVLYRCGKNRFLKYKINKSFPSKKVIRTEVYYSILACLFFALSGVILLEAWRAGLTQIYLDPAEFGYLYLFLSVFLLMFLHDTYFYWLHRAIHHPKLFKRFHRVHHLSVNPTPWAAFSFNLGESFLEAIILPVLVLIVPVNIGALGFFLMLMTFFGTINHCGYEFYSKKFAQSFIWKWWISPTHHYMHHERLKTNFGLYFTFWDRLMGTEDADYVTIYEGVKARQGE